MTALEVVPDPPLRCAIYCRISADMTGEGQGVDRQERTCRELVDAHGWIVDHVLVDNDASAYSGTPRPAYDRLLALIEAGEVDVVTAVHTDRLYRRPRDLERLVDVIERHRVTVRTVGAGELDLSTATGRMVAKMLASVAEHESARTGERVAAKHQSNAESGRAHGGTAPYGYARTGVPGELVVVEDEARLVREAARRILKGEALNAIVADLNARGEVTKTGKAWRARTMSGILRSPTTAGKRATRGKIVTDKAKWEPVLDEATWTKVVRKMSHTPQGRRPRTFLLAKFMRCGACGSRMHSSSSGSKDHRHRQYACVREEPGACGSRSIAAKPSEEHVVGLLLELLGGVNLHTLRARRSVADTRQLIHDIAEDDEMLRTLAADYGHRRITRDEWDVLREIVEKRLKANRHALGQVESRDVIGEGFPSSMNADDWDGLSFDEQRALIGLFIDRVEVGAVRNRGKFDTGRLSVVWHD